MAKENEAKLLRRVKGDEKRATFKSEVLKEQTRRVENAIVSKLLIQNLTNYYNLVEAK